MLTIRFQRTGTKNRPDFRIVLAESLRAADKKFLEILGSYNPRTKNFAVKNEERLKHWLGKNVAMSPSVHNLFVEKQLVSAKKVKAWAPKKKSAEGGSASGGEVKAAAPSGDGASLAPQEREEAKPAEAAAPAPAETKPETAPAEQLT